MHERINREAPTSTINRLPNLSGTKRIRLLQETSGGFSQKGEVAMKTCDYSDGHCAFGGMVQVGVLLRGTIVNRTYGACKILYISLFLLTMFGSVCYGPPK